MQLKATLLRGAIHTRERETVRQGELLADIEPGGSRAGASGVGRRLPRRKGPWAGGTGRLFCSQEKHGYGSGAGPEANVIPENSQESWHHCLDG